MVLEGVPWELLDPVVGEKHVGVVLEGVLLGLLDSMLASVCVLMEEVTWSCWDDDDHMSTLHYQLLDQAATI